jgi:hypothetical protein
MLHQVARRACLLASMNNANGVGHTPIGQILEGTPRTTASARPMVHTRMEQLSLDVYTLLLARLRNTHSNHAPRHYRDLPHPPNSNVVAPWVHHKTHVDSPDQKRRTFAVHTAHAGNSAIIFRSSSGCILHGFIHSIWTHTFREQVQTYFVVRPHDTLSVQDRKRSPFASRPKLAAQLFYSASAKAFELITLTDIISHTAYIARPPGTFKIKQGTILVVNLDRGRSHIVY